MFAPIKIKPFPEGSLSDPGGLARHLGMNETQVISLGQKLLDLMTGEDAEDDIQIIVKGGATLAGHLQGRPITTRADVFAVWVCRAVKAWEYLEVIYAQGEDPWSPLYREAFEDCDKKSGQAAGMGPSPGEEPSEKELLALGCLWDVIDP